MAGSSGLARPKVSNILCPLGTEYGRISSLSPDEVMLIECTGLPGAGKTTIARHIAKLLPHVRVRAGGLRRAQYRMYRAFRYFQANHSDVLPSHILDTLIRGYSPSEVLGSRLATNLQWRGGLARKYQAHTQVILSDELLIHALFTLMGPLRIPCDRVTQDIEEVVRAVYDPARVIFLHVEPPRAQWLDQLRGRRRGRSRFGRSADPVLMDELQHDGVYEHGILPVLREGYTVHTVGGPGTVEALAERLNQGSWDESHNRYLSESGLSSSAPGVAQSDQEFTRGQGPDPI